MKLKTAGTVFTWQGLNANGQRARIFEGASFRASQYSSVTDII